MSRIRNRDRRGRRPPISPRTGAGAILIAVLLMGSDADATDVGYVLDKTGDWALAPSPQAERLPLAIGQALPAGGRIYTTETTSEGAQVTVALFNAAARSCALRNGAALCDCEHTPRTRSCEEPLILPDTFMKEQPSFWGRVQDVLRRFGAQPGRYVSTISRGSSFLRETVVSAEDGVADLAAVVADFPRGTYHLYFVPLSVLGERGANPIRMQWNRGERALAQGLKPGLYALHTSDPRTRSSRPTRDHAWILVVEGRDYAAAAARFSGMREVTASWGDSASEAAKQTFLRSVLSLLGEELDHPQ